MAVWETDDEFTTGLGAGSLPTPQGGTPFRTPSAASKKSSRRSVTPPGRGTSPTTMSTERSEKRSSRDVTTDETISILDPRRFTPTLHANLVSEILALRRDQEEKTKQIESLESTLHTVREEHDRLQVTLTDTTKESRSLQRQLSLLEGGTSSALGELARERDDAVESIAEAKKRLDSAQRKIRSQEDDSQRVHDLWAQEKETWDVEKRKFERRVHIAESRLKVVLDEVAAYQATHMNGAHHGTGHGHDSDAEESGKENDAGSVRTMSLTNSIRHSLLHTSGAGLFQNGHSLADELNFDDDDTDIDGRESVLSNHSSPAKHRRNYSRDSVPSRMHRRNQSAESLKRPGSVARAKPFIVESLAEALEVEEEEVEEDTILGQPARVAMYVDSGIQYSPPPSPSPEPPIVKPATPDLPIRGKTPEVDSPSRGDLEIEANQRRKRVHASRPLSIEPPRMNKMVSAAAQTMDGPLSPPKTPQSPYGELSPYSDASEAVPMVCSSTQTEEPARTSRGLSPARHTVPPPLAIPSISVQPPTSRPTTPRSPRLPQYFKHFGCQVSMPISSDTADASVQTEGIQIDKRLALLPPHLQPSAISSRPTSPNVASGFGQDKNFTPTPGNIPARNPRRSTHGRHSNELHSSPISRGADDELHDAYPGQNDDGPLANNKGAPVRRPHRFSSLFAGFDTASSDEADEFGDGDLSDSEYRTALSAPRPQSISSRPPRRGSFGTVTTSPEQPSVKPPGTTVKPVSSELYNSFNLAEKENQPKKHEKKLSRTYEKAPAPPPPAPSSRASVMRKAAMIQSGIASHQGRSRSPSLPDTKNPPFPIPTRASSRQPPFSSSTTSDGQRSPTRRDYWHRRGSSRSSYQTHSIRKVRSAAALPRNQRHRRNGSRSPPPLSPSTEAPESPGLPPLPRNDITTPRNKGRPSNSYKRHRHELSTNTDNTNNTEPTTQTNGSQTPGVVDAIAQTMVGEWMLKYVRRRKSFGMPESTGKDDSSNDRHKRWVWLAPYERAILWSSKQPSSGSALMGKTGRKLTIQSVLDVKDDNPAPKVMPNVFNRSILILTPQRALKFTATSAERHYLWLTALSFLAHSSQAVPDIPAPQPQVKLQPHAQQPLPEFEMPRSRFKRGGIRDSIRLAKGKTSVGRAGTPSVPSIPSAPSSRMGDMASFRLPEMSSVASGGHSREESRDAAEPPFIPRFTERSNGTMAHGRKRSNTGGHVAPPLSFRGFSGPAGTGAHHNSSGSTANASVGTAGSSDIYQSQGSSNTTWGHPASQRTSEASSRPGGNFFDAIGTVRMEAFISPLAFSQFNEYPDEQEEFRQTMRRRSKEIRRRNSRSRHREQNGQRGGRSDQYSRGRTMEDDYFKDDPFKGF
ncbi:nuclear migration protein [Purpureocillium lavendulum]|uniref:Nuclear migration protein n=1 Tax=Purpureocillium lavendulum TaxID=1247861 RepID=A0AB34FNC7_9HYPO|nr:nuclear migration protein [Purpureocillium lavendulum]